MAQTRARKLILFDIDGTLLVARGQGRENVTRILSEIIGKPITTEGVVFAGSTDPQIMRQVLQCNNVPEAHHSELLPRILAAYTAYAAKALDPSRVAALPGACDLVWRLHDHPDVQLGLLTGNVERVAYAKVRAIGLEHCFPFGAFGSDHAKRSALPAIAVQRAFAHTKHRFWGKDIVIIGDTPNDILCGQSLGVTAIAVTTGHFDEAALAIYQPDLIVPSLRETASLGVHFYGQA